MIRQLPPPAQIQKWILQITPNPYFERFVGSPGLLVLRVKKRRGEYQGLHLALSEAKAKELGSALSALKPRQDAIFWNASQPHGRAWTSLYTSGIDFRSWRTIGLRCGTAETNDTVQMGFQAMSLVHLTFNPQSLKCLTGLIQAPVYPPQPAPLTVLRPEKPRSEPHHLWLWKWGI
jgi:hypothetical protein